VLGRVRATTQRLRGGREIGARALGWAPGR
jgi:hypothetical protein